MNDLWLIFKVLYYLLFVLALFLYAKYKYKRDKINKFGFWALIIFAVLFGIYGVICGPTENIGDRFNYAYRFENLNQIDYVRKSSLGLFVLESVLHIFTTNANVLFFVVSVFYFCVNIYCYKKLDKATPFYLLLLFLSSFGLFGFYLLKQALSLAFAILAFTKYTQKKNIWAVVFLIIAMLFHESAIILVPCFLIARYLTNTKKKRLICYIGLALIVLFFPLISKVLVNVFGSIPGMDAQIDNYLDSEGGIAIDMNYFTIFKSMPYYLITIAGFVFRKSVRKKIENYDFLLMLSVFCSAFSLMSVYMYWMFRFATYFYVPCFVLATELYNNLRYKDNRKIFAATITLILLVLMIKLLLQYYFIYGGIV